VVVIRLTVFGDFNCAFSALASVRVDVLLAAGNAMLDWRAVQHDPSIPPTGQRVDGAIAETLAEEIATIVDLSEPDVRLHLVAPPIRSNTAMACAAFAAARSNPHRLRRRLFAAVWAQGANLGDPAALHHVGATGRDAVRAVRWQKQFRSLPRPVTPTLVLPNGFVLSGVSALDCLAELGTARSVSRAASDR
jgi:predicted DsbA family dithiol-disulfide isomerase